MKSTENFEQIISAELELMALRDPLFAKALQKENKSIEGCIGYILTTVQKSGINGFADNEIIKMAIHYYDEDDVKGLMPGGVNIVINRIVELTEEEIKKAKDKAFQQVVEEEKQRIKKKKTSVTTVDTKFSNLLFDESKD